MLLNPEFIPLTVSIITHYRLLDVHFLQLGLYIINIFEYYTVQVSDYTFINFLKVNYAELF